ncbi:uncharacterized protein FOMMEDRAFT_169871 [Fomitiporia mediterranea MF3/22]|uniref:uncharacterized protein n=1 Tax=Fomitiporia mediterranea (strain MF3/22) TaxID=694068 RepID=UPI0004408839|nr:uncharacterized protein FOMMEDRAFT_169871 [Fomitiporia mediterranea MF3/22]EJD00395.1 hypothetical protein FOMMEDRAFT_169871 [Fomitiporia mediterranea MF3/22]
MEDLPDPLPDLDPDGLPELRSLSHAWPLLSIPKLEERPQNPIIASLSRVSSHKSRSNVDPFIQTHDIHVDLADEVEDDGDLMNIWLQAKEIRYDYKSHLVSWDTLRNTYLGPKSPSSFISEQPSDIVMVARRTSGLLSSASNTGAISVSATELHDLLSSMLVGCASVYHKWNADEEQFVLINYGTEKRHLFLDGMDEIVSNSYVSRCVEFGTLFRRLQTLTAGLQNNDNTNNSTVSAFAHSLSSVLVWIRHKVTEALSVTEESICNIWVALQEVEEIVLALASLSSRGLSLGPKSYQSLPQIPQRLLSHIYNFLTLQIERQVPRVVRGILSYVLTITSRPYFTALAHSVGLVGLADLLADARRRLTKSHGDIMLDDQGSDGSYPDSEVESEFNTNNEFPSFILDGIRDAAIRARRSIRILSSPEFEDVQVLDLPVFNGLEWVWTDEEVSNRALKQKSDASGSDPSSSQEVTHRRILEASVQQYKPELAALATFDLEPGCHISAPGKDVTSFVFTYPTLLPSLAPTLPLLAEHVLAPISIQANALGRAALQRFLTPGTSLHFRAHLVLLRAYLLLTAPAFKARLTAALFSDADSDEDLDADVQENPMSIAIRRRTRSRSCRTTESRGGEQQQSVYDQPWPVGIALGLTRRGQWPPDGSELALFLRRVIMDSLDHVREAELVFEGNNHKDDLGDDEFWDDAENRLGFAIRDLPDGTGREKWLDPTTIEALDFLYMQYRPPIPLRCLITTDILSKYQRIFAFLLRLVRVETAMRLAFRLTRRYSFEHVFVNYPNAQSLIQPFRFAAQAFLSAFSAYVADTAIRGNVDAFIARVRYAETVATSNPENQTGPFVDVYALMQRHSRTLDAVLAACLLRSAQRAVGDIMRALLEVILEFAVLVGNAYRFAGGNVKEGVFDEERAAMRVEALYGKFCKTRDALVKALRKIKERGAKPFASEGPGRPYDGLPSASGGMEALSDLLLRLAEINDGKK